MFNPKAHPVVLIGSNDTIEQLEGLITGPVHTYKIISLNNAFSLRLGLPYTRKCSAFGKLWPDRRYSETVSDRQCLMSGWAETEEIFGDNDADTHSSAFVVSLWYHFELGFRVWYWNI